MNPNTSSTAALAGNAKRANWDSELTSGLVKLGLRCVERALQPLHWGSSYVVKNPGRELVGGIRVRYCSTFGIRGLNDLTTHYIPQTRELRQVQFLGKMGGAAVLVVAIISSQFLVLSELRPALVFGRWSRGWGGSF